MNVWEPFDVQILDIFGLQWTLVAFYSSIWCPFLIQKKLFANMRILVLFVWLKFHFNSRFYEFFRSILEEGGLVQVSKITFRQLFCYFLTFWSHFVDIVTLWQACVYIVDDEQSQIIFLTSYMDSFPPSKFLLVLVLVDYHLYAIDLWNKIMWFF